MEWNIEIAAGICLAVILHHIMAVVTGLVHVQVVASALAK